MGQINTNNYPAVDSLLDADLLIVENATHGTGTTTPKQLRENAIGTDPLQTTAQTVTSAINEIFEMATDTVIGLELGKMTSFSDGVIVTDIDLHREPAEGDRILFYHSSAVASPSSLTTYNDGVAVTKSIMDFSMTHPIGLTLMEFGLLGWTTVQDIAAGGYTAGTGISINGTTISNSAPQLGDDIAYSRIDSVTSGALGYFSADADCLVMDFRTDAEPYNGGYTLRLTTTGASFKYAVLKDRAGNNYAEEIPAGSLVMCKSNVSGTGSEADPVVVTVLEIGNTEMAHDVEVLKDICITEKTATGNPLTVTDALPYAALSLSADIEPIQDLHGQSAPYVGGAGKNKWVIDEAFIKSKYPSYDLNTHKLLNFNGIDIEVLVDDANNPIGIHAEGTPPTGVNLAFNTGEIVLPKDVQYRLSSGVNTNNQNVFARLSGPNDAYTYAWASTTTEGTVFSVGADNINLYFNLRFGQNIPVNITFKPWLMLESETDKSFAPYSNICPISGHTSVTVNNHGKNVLPNNLADGTIDGITYTKQSDSSVKFNGTSTGRANAVIAEYHLQNGTWIVSKGQANALFGLNVEAYNNSTWVKVLAQSFSTDEVQFVVDNNGYNKIRVSITTESGRTANNLVYYPMIRSASDSDPTYAPFTGNTNFTIQLGQTVYGGTLNANTGVLTVDRVGVDLGSLDWEYTSSIDRFSAPLTGVKNVSNWNAIYVIDSYYSLNAVTGNSPIDKIIGVYGTNVYVHDTAYNDASALATALNGQTLVYELTTPTTIQLTPEQLTMLKGYNRLSSDGGGDLTLTYKADRLAAIEAALAAL